MWCPSRTWYNSHLLALSTFFIMVLLMPMYFHHNQVMRCLYFIKRGKMKCIRFVIEVSTFMSHHTFHSQARLSLFVVTSAGQAFEACDGALEPGVVVEGDLRHDVVRPVVLVEVVRGGRTSHQSSIQLVCIIHACVIEGVPGTLGRWGGTSRCLG